MKYNFLIFILLASLFLAGNAAAQVEFPVAELGNCKDQQECKAYCDNPENGDACMEYAKENNLMTDQEITVAKKFISGEINGPGGCDSKESCEAYCNDMSRIDECIAFAESNNLMPESELQDAKKVQAAIKQGIKPPACKNKKSCDAYCESSDHMEECITFAIQAGLMPPEEQANAQKMLQAIKQGIKPPPCKGKEECDAYCNKPENMEICMTFAMEAGLMAPEEQANAQKMLQAIKQGIKPPPCKGKEECDAYCQSDEHMEECITFAVAAGMMTKEDAEMSKKTGGKGPGGCKSKEECEAYCKDHQEECFKFGEEHGLNEGFQQKTGPGGCKSQEECEKYCADHPEECAQFGPGEGPTPCKTPEECQAMEEKCSSNPDDPACKGFMQKFEENSKNGPQPQLGPGGCKTPEECDTYCKDHPDECGGGKSTGPGGCTSEAECEAYCSTHREECGAPSPGTNLQQCQGAECDSWHAEGQGGPMPGPSSTTGPGTDQAPPPMPPAPPASDAGPSGFLLNPDSLVASMITALINYLIK